MSHVHTPEKHDDVLALDWCECGYEFKGGSWRPPKTMEGFIRRSRWNPEEEA